MSADIYEQIRQAVDAAPDPLQARHDALRFAALPDDTRPGVAAPDLEGRWRRALAINPEAILGALQRQRPPAAAFVYGNQRSFEIRLPDGGGRLILTWVPDGC